MAAALLASALLVFKRPPLIADVGPPFNVNHLEKSSLWYSGNVMPEYLLAGAAFVRLSTVAHRAQIEKAEASADAAAIDGWQAANNDARHWLQQNREALARWRVATAGDKAMEIPLDKIDIDSPMQVSENARPFARLALLEASRLAADGHAGQAWDWYRGVLRASRHYCMNAGVVGRRVGASVFNMARDPVLCWAARPDVTASDLRQALRDSQGADGMTPSLTENLQVEYLAHRNSLPKILADVYQVNLLAAIETQLSGRPERIRRGMNLYFANWLAHADRPRWRRQRLADKQIELFEREPGEKGGPELPSASMLRELSAMQLTGLERDLTVFHDPIVDYRLPRLLSLFDMVDEEQVDRTAVIVGLALQLHRREKGAFPKTLQELVSAGYLTALPPDPFGKGEPMHYRRENTTPQQAILWSVGLDEVDDGGTPGATTDDQQSPKDIVFKIVAKEKPPK